MPYGKTVDLEGGARLETGIGLRRMMLVGTRERQGIGEYGAMLRYAQRVD